VRIFIKKDANTIEPESPKMTKATNVLKDPKVPPALLVLLAVLLLRHLSLATFYDAYGWQFELRVTLCSTFNNSYSACRPYGGIMLDIR
jgi:hypothetical protein